MNTKIFTLLLLAAILFVRKSEAQVTIGGNTDPVAGAILDLNSPAGSKGGLLVSSVDLTDLSEIPATGFVGITTAQPTNMDLAGTVVYNTNQATGLGLYVWDGDDWIKLADSSVGEPVCNRIQHVIAFAKGSTNILGKSGTLQFGVVSDGTNHSSVNPIKKSYQWESTGANNRNWSRQGAPLDYTNDSKSIFFPSEGTYYVRTIADNCYSSPQTSNEIKVVVSATPANLVNKGYRVITKDCYDIARSGHDLSLRRDDFSGSTFVKSYRFSHINNYTDLQLFIASDPDNLVSSITFPPLSQINGTGRGFVDFKIVFKPTVSDLVGDRGKKVFRIAASYKDNTNTDKMAYLDVKVQDAECACKVAFRTTPTGPIGWRRFMCYNIGADEALSIDDQRAFESPVSLSNPTTYSNEAAAASYTKVYGSLFQWGRKADGHQHVWSAVTSAKAPVVDWNNAGANFRKTSDGFLGINDWLSGSNNKPGRWGGDSNGENNDENWPLKGPNDPCPEGWRIPSISEWNTIWSAPVQSPSGSSNGVNRWVWVSSVGKTTPGMLLYPPKPNVTDPKDDSDYEPDPSLFLPVGGFRQGFTGKIPTIGIIGYYWSSSTSDVFSRYFLVEQNFSPLQMGLFRSHGCAIRCVEE